jgi:hypothetical protein
MGVDEDQVREYLRKKGRSLHHREGQELEFKEQFSFAGLAEYFKDFAAFANNRGGYLIFGVTDTPRTAAGLSKKAEQQFETIDPERISGFLLDIFAGDIRWHQALVDFGRRSFGAFRIEEAVMKPIIAKRDEGKDNTIKNGEIYYRYGGRTQKILSAELERIIDRRVENNNSQWLDLMSKIARAGPGNAAILDTEKALIQKDDSKILVLDEKLAEKLKFVKEGRFSDKKGKATLQLVGDVVPVDRVEVIKRIKESITKQYRLSATELACEVKKRLPDAGQNEIWDVIRDNGLKDNQDYSAYNFRNKKHEDDYAKTGKLPSVTPSIYNEAAVDLIVKVLGNAKSSGASQA